MSLPESAWQTAMESWPDALFEMSLVKDRVPLSRNDLINIGLATPDFRRALDTEERPTFSAATRKSLDNVLAEHSDGGFIRLGFCSFKHPFTVLSPLKNGQDALRLMSMDNERVATFAVQYLLTEKPCVLFISSWCSIPKWAEFRIFIRDYKVIGISQYHHRTRYAELNAKLLALEHSLYAFAERLLETLHIPSAAADVWIDLSDASEATHLIDLNPLIRQTDPCLFSWNDTASFDGGLRIWE